MAPVPTSAITRRDWAMLLATTAVASGQNNPRPQPAEARKWLDENRALLNAVELPMNIEPAVVFKP